MTKIKAQMKRIKEFAEEQVKDLDYNHNFEHVIKVVKGAEIIAAKEGADLVVCQAAAYLHDIGQSVKFEGHEERGADMAREFLGSLKLPDEFIKAVCHAIAVHASSDIHRAETLEARVLYDADKLQILGVFGFNRLLAEMTAFKKMTLKEAVKTVEEIQLKTFDKLQTNTGRELMRATHEFMIEFYRLYKQWDEMAI